MDKHTRKLADIITELQKKPKDSPKSEPIQQETPKETPKQVQPARTPTQEPVQEPVQDETPLILTPEQIVFHLPEMIDVSPDLIEVVNKISSMSNMTIDEQEDLFEHCIELFDNRVKNSDGVITPNEWEIFKSLSYNSFMLATN